MKKFFGYVVVAIALGCFVAALFMIGARFGFDIALICLASGLGFGALGIGNKMIA